MLILRFLKPVEHVYLDLVFLSWMDVGDLHRLLKSERRLLRHREHMEKDGLTRNNPEHV